MFANLEAVKAIVRQHDLRYLVVLNMDGQKQHQESGPVDRLCRALDEAAALLAGEPFRVEAWKTGNGEAGDGAKGGKRAKLAEHFKWIVRPDRGAAPVVQQVASASPELVEAINGLRDRVDELAEVEPEAESEPAWLAPAMERAFRLADVLLARLAPPGAAPEAITGSPASAPVGALPPDDELLRAVMRARKDPANAAFVRQVVAAYGDEAAARAEKSRANG